MHTCQLDLLAQDLGNSLYSLFLEKTAFSRDRGIRLVVDALQAVRPALQLSPRHDILYAGAKVSGSAFRIVRDRAYHHGTMLLDANLAQLQRLLTCSIPEAVRGAGAAISSVPSAVRNIGRVDNPSLPDLDHGLFGDLLAQHLSPTECIDVEEEQLGANEQICQLAAELQSDAWIFGKTPSFEITVPGGTSVRIEGGRIVHGPSHLLGQRFDPQLLGLAEGGTTADAPRH